MAGSDFGARLDLWHVELGIVEEGLRQLYEREADSSPLMHLCLERLKVLLEVDGVALVGEAHRAAYGAVAASGGVVSA